jgi:hypothetical protein
MALFAYDNIGLKKILGLSEESAYLSPPPKNLS